MGRPIKSKPYTHPPLLFVALTPFHICRVGEACWPTPAARPFPMVPPPWCGRRFGSGRTIGSCTHGCPCTKSGKQHFAQRTQAFYLKWIPARAPCYARPCVTARQYPQLAMGQTVQQGRRSWVVVGEFDGRGSMNGAELWGGLDSCAPICAGVYGF